MLQIKNDHTGGYSFVLFDVDNGQYIYTHQMSDDYPDWDMCSGTAVIDVLNTTTVGEDITIDPNNDSDVQALDVANRVLDSYRSQGNDMRVYGREKELYEIALQVAKRAGIRAYGVENDRYQTTVTDDLERAEHICFVQPGERSDYHGREFAAMCNGLRWSIHTGPLERVNKWVADEWGTLEDYDYYGLSTGDTYGYTWLDIDLSGDSTPTEAELIEVANYV